MSENKLKEFTKFDYCEYGERCDIPFLQEGIMPISDSSIHGIVWDALNPKARHYLYFEEKYYPPKDISTKINHNIYQEFWFSVSDYILYYDNRVGNYYCDYYVDQSYRPTDLPEYKSYGKDFVFQLFLTRLINLFANYIFGGTAETFIKSIQEENSKDEENKFDIDDCATLLLDFMNFAARTRGWHEVFTLKELHDEFVYQKHKAELKELKKFIEDSSWYMSNLLDGKDTDEIFGDILDCHHIHIPKVLNKRVLSDASVSQREILDDELYTLAYAYAKLNNKTKEEYNKGITKNVREDFLSYTQMLQSEEPVDKILDEILIKNGISSGESIKKLISKELPANQKERIDNALYALACAYSYNKINYKAPNEIIRDKIKEMSIR